MKYYQFSDDELCVIDYFFRRLSQELYKKVTYIRMRKFMIQKIKSLFISMKVQLITISSVIPYISEINSTSSSLKKKKKRASRERKREGKRGRESAKGKEKEMEKRRRRRREERKRD